MKRAIIILFILSFLISNGQIKNTITNAENFELSTFSNLTLLKKITKYNFTITLNKIGWSKYDFSEREAEIIGITRYELNSGLVFKKNGDDLKTYYYPVSKNFKSKNFKNEINSDLKNDIKVKFYTTIYKTEANPIIIINCIELIKQSK